jgi:transposase
LGNEEPPGYRRRKEREKPVLGPFIPLIEEILEADKKAPKKQRHTAKRIFERLREKGYTGGLTVVGEEVRRIKRRSAEVFMPLAHRPGEAQADFGEATVVYRGQERKIAFFVMTLPFSDAIFCQAFPRECTEAFQEGHRRAFEFFDGVPKRITYDNTKIAVAKVIRLLLEDGRETPVKYFRLDGRPHLQGRVVPAPNLSLYDTLRPTEACHEEA